MSSTANATSTDVTSSIQTTQYSLIWVGIGVSVCGNFLISLSFQLQKDVHKKNEGKAEEDKIPFTSSPQWWLGLLCMAMGEVGNFLAYGMAPASLVSPLGAVTVVSNAVLSRLILKESLSTRKIVGICFALVGAVLIAINAPSPQSGATGSKDARGAEQPQEAIYDSLISWRALIYLAIVVFLVVYIANPRKWSFAISEEYAKSQVVCYCLVCGLLGAITVMSSKGVSTAINQGLAGQAAMFADGRICWLTYLLILSAAGSIVLQMKYLNAALDSFESSQVVPVYYIIFTTITISAGMCLFLEISFAPLVRSVLLFVLGILLAFFGVYLIGADPDSAHHKDEKHAAADEHAARPELSAEERENLKMIFKDLDLDHNDTVDQKELCSLQAALHQHWGDDGSEMMKKMDTDKSGGVSFEEFLDWYVELTTPDEKVRLKEHAEELFKKLKVASNVLGVAAPGAVLYSSVNLQKRASQMIQRPARPPPAGGEGGTTGLAKAATLSSPPATHTSTQSATPASTLTREDRQRTFHQVAKQVAQTAKEQASATMPAMSKPTPPDASIMQFQQTVPPGVLEAGFGGGPPQVSTFPQYSKPGSGLGPAAPGQSA